MVQKLNPTISLPQISNPQQVMAWGQALVQQLIQQFAYVAARDNSLLAGDGTEAATEPVLLASYTVAGVPAAASYTGGIIYVSNGTSNKRLAVSDGTNWRFPDGNIIS